MGYQSPSSRLYDRSRLTPLPLQQSASSRTWAPHNQHRSPSSPLLSSSPSPTVVPAVARSLKNIAPAPSRANNLPPSSIHTVSANQIAPAQPNFLRLQELQNKCYN